MSFLPLSADAYEQLIADYNAGAITSLAGYILVEVGPPDAPAPEPGDEPQPEPEPVPVVVQPGGGCTSRQAANYDPTAVRAGTVGRFGKATPASPTGVNGFLN